MARKLLSLSNTLSYGFVLCACITSSLCLPPPPNFFLKVLSLLVIPSACLALVSPAILPTTSNRERRASLVSAMEGAGHQPSSSRSYEQSFLKFTPNFLLANVTIHVASSPQWITSLLSKIFQSVCVFTVLHISSPVWSKSCKFLIISLLGNNCVEYQSFCTFAAAFLSP